MSKRKLSKQQARRIAHIHAIRQAQAEINADELGDLSPEQSGLLIVRFGKSAIVCDDNGHDYTCHFRQNLANPVAGDRVIWRAGKNNTGVITAIQPRKTVLSKTSRQGDPKPIAANITTMVIVIAPEPEPSFELLDRYLIAAENLHFKAMIVFNKYDLPLSPVLKKHLSIYQDIGYPVLYTSTVAHSCIDQLKNELTGNISIVVGQSGVGKSSLLNALIPNLDLRIGELSKRTHLGKHTTSTTTLYKIATDSYIIDSPGVRNFKLQHINHKEITLGYKEIYALQQSCQFRNCQHQIEPGCALQQAVTNHSISELRFKNYLKICGDP